MRSTLDTFADALVTTVIESDDFGDAVAAQIESNVAEAVDKAVEQIDLSSDIKDGVAGYVDKLESDLEDVRVDVDAMKAVITGLLHKVHTLIEENKNLEQELKFARSDIRLLSDLVQKTRDALRTIPIIRRWFK